MTATLKFRNFLLDKRLTTSRSEYKRLMLTGYLAVTCLLVAVVYTVLDLGNKVYYALPAYVVLFVIPICSLLLIRAKKFMAAKITLLVAINLVVFWSALNDPFETGVFMFFIPTGIGAFSILAFKDRKAGLAMIALTTALFLTAYFGDFQIAAERPSELYIKMSFVFNYFISTLVSVLSVYFLMNLNKQSEEELIRKEHFVSQKNAELQNVNDALDRFVYSVSHDLRSPLSSILGLINLANLTKDPNELVQIIKMIQGRVLAQDNFIREIIDYSRNARTETVVEPLNLKKQVDEVIDTLKFDGLADKIEFRIKIPDDCILISDKIRLTVILNNLIGNAIKYHNLTRETPFIEVRFQDDVCSLHVEDNGSGVMPQHQQKIFNMFYRGSDRVTGSGLGLFITREAVAKLGGTISLKSVYGEGSTFTVTFPKKAAAPVQQTAAAKQA
ncbi:MAG TPA: HAMP domain-containing sensor histidine kinase [Chryseolinea sp.]